MERWVTLGDARWRGVPVACVLVAVSLVACRGGLGPSTLRFDRNQYNIAVQQTDAQELLLNLVRLRYRDTPFFLQVASISANVKMVKAIGAGGSLPEGGPNVVSLDGTLAYEQSPTVTYTPLQGEQFVKQLLEPVELEILLLLSSSGWAVDRALRLLVQEINGVPNAPTASGPTPRAAPEFEDFLRASRLMRKLQQRDLVDLSTSNDAASGESGSRVFLLLDEAAVDLPETRELVELLHLAPGRRYYEIVSGIGAVDPSTIKVVPRSIVAAMAYASQAVDVPVEDESSGRVTVTIGENGNPFDWTRLLGDLIHIQSGGRPHDAYVSVEYRGHWFYIDDADLESKSTFSLLTMVLALQAGDVPSTGPVLTLPVSR